MFKTREFLIDLITYAGYGILIALVLIWIFSETLWMRLIAIAALLFLIYQFARMKK